MPPFAPPADLRATPVLQLLPAGTTLWRTHHARRAGQPFRDRPSDPQFGRGRFDGAPPDAYPFCYAGASPATALMEHLMRGVPYRDDGQRVLRRAAVAGHQLSAMELLDDLRLVGLRTQEELAAVRQDSWLIHADPPEYAKTSAWARWIRLVAPTAAGLIWPSKRDVGGHAVVLFGDRCGHLVLPSPAWPTRDLDTVDGAAFLNTELARYRVTIRPPRTP
jgi:hypothetical protein